MFLRKQFSRQYTVRARGIKGIFEENGLTSQGLYDKGIFRGFSEGHGHFTRLMALVF
jgi:hypothetical protein